MVSRFVQNAAIDNSHSHQVSKEVAFDISSDLSWLDDDALVVQLQEDLFDGYRNEVETGIRILLLERGWSAEQVLDKVVIEGMRVVGIYFRHGNLSQRDAELAVKTMKNA